MNRILVEIRWVDRLLPSNFEIEFLPSTRKGLVNYILREPNVVIPKLTQYREKFKKARLDLIKRAAKKFLLTKSKF